MKHFLLLLITLIRFIDFTYCQPGTLDQSFGNGGRVITDVTDDYGRCSVMQPDGKIVVGGSSGSDAFLIRYTTTGSVDNTFGDNGKVLTHLDATSSIQELKILNNGKILGVGYVIINASQVLLIRYNSDGSLDSSFGDKGKIISDFRGWREGQSIQVLDNGDIVALAYIFYNGTIPQHNTFELIKFHPDGTLDSSFGLNGVQNPLFPDNTMAWSLQMTKDKKIVTCGYKPFYSAPTILKDSVFVMRFTSDGFPDSTFGNNSMSTVFVNSLYDYHSSLLVDNNDKIFVSAFSSDSHGNFAILKFTGGGALDSSFGVNGVAITRITTTNEGSYSYDNPFCLALQDDGKILQAGSVRGSSNVDFGIVRLKTNGALDSSFGTNGIVITAVGSSDEQANSILLQQDKKIVATGLLYNGSNYDVGLVRYNYDVVVPLKLLDFSLSYNGQANLLKWITSEEINTARFEVERKNNQAGFSSIGSIDARGNALRYEYSFSDNTPSTGVNYYRLKMIDKDGKYSYSSIQRINNAEYKNIRLFPNPTHDILNLQGLFQEQKTELTIIDMTGKVLMKKNLTASGLSWNINKLNNGKYLLQVITVTSSQTIPFIKQ